MHLKISSAKWWPFCPAGRWVKSLCQRDYRASIIFLLHHISVYILQFWHTMGGTHPSPRHDAKSPLKSKWRVQRDCEWTYGREKGRQLLDVNVIITPLHWKCQRCRHLNPSEVVVMIMSGSAIDNKVAIVCLSISLSWRFSVFRRSIKT